MQYVAACTGTWVEASAIRTQAIFCLEKQGTRSFLDDAELVHSNLLPTLVSDIFRIGPAALISFHLFIIVSDSYFITNLK
jgi:hypothetical protein